MQHQRLVVQKICSRWIQHNLTKAKRKWLVSVCEKSYFANLIAALLSTYIGTIVIGDKTQILSYKPEKPVNLNQQKLFIQALQK